MKTSLKSILLAGVMYATASCAPAITTEQSSGYDERYREYAIHLIENNVLPEKVNGLVIECETYHSLIELAKTDLPDDEKNLYNPRLSCRGIAELIKAKISPQTANQYAERFGYWDIIAMQKAKDPVPPIIANRYPGCNGRDIVEIVKNNIAPETIEKCNRAIKCSKLTGLLKEGITPEKINANPKKYNPWMHVPE